MPRDARFARQRHLHERGSDVRRRAKRARRNPQRDFGVRVELAGGGKIAVFAAAGARGDARGDFELHHDVDRSDLVRVAEEMVENRRGDVVGQIAVNAEFSAGEFREIELRGRRPRRFRRRAIRRVGRGRLPASLRQGAGRSRWRSRGGLWRRADASFRRGRRRSRSRRRPRRAAECSRIRFCQPGAPRKCWPNFCRAIGSPSVTTRH